MPALIPESQIEIDAGTLRDWLEDGEHVQVIDIRRKADYEDWHIAEANNLDVQEALAYRQPGDLATFAPQSDAPVIAICYVGHTSNMAARYLRTRGIQAVSVKGGMHAWSLAWNTAEVPLKKSSARVIQVRRAGKGCLSYLIGSNGETAVIDASVNPKVYVDLAAQRNWKITKVIDTHIHADHVTRGRTLAEQTSAAYCLPNQQRARFSFQAMRDGDELKIGKSRLRVLHTPGHTNESVCLVLDDVAIFTGDTLFLKGIGRPDLKADAEEIEKRTRLLYKTLQMLLQLRGELIVLPAHTGEPIAFDGKPLMASLEEVKGKTDLLSAAEEDFVKTVLSRIPMTPPNHLEIVELNEVGILPPYDLAALEAGANRCAI